MFLVVALIAGVLGFTGVAVAAAGISKGAVRCLSGVVFDLSGRTSRKRPQIAELTG